VFTWIKSFDLGPEVVKDTVALAKFFSFIWLYFAMHPCVVVLAGNYVPAKQRKEFWPKWKLAKNSKFLPKIEFLKKNFQKKIFFRAQEAFSAFGSAFLNSKLPLKCQPGNKPGNQGCRDACNTCVSSGKKFEARKNIFSKMTSIGVILCGESIARVPDA
jgi:hypothetical protein